MLPPRVLLYCAGILALLAASPFPRARGQGAAPSPAGGGDLDPKSIPPPALPQSSGGAMGGAGGVGAPPPVMVPVGADADTAPGFGPYVPQEGLGDGGLPPLSDVGVGPLQDSPPGPPAPPAPTLPDSMPDGYAFIDCGPEERPGRNGVYQASTKADHSPVGYTISRGSSNSTIPAQPGLLLSSAESTLRAFPRGDLGCYKIFLLQGETVEWSVRMAFAYYNYDGEGRYPNFTVYINSLRVDQIALGDWEVAGSSPSNLSAPGGRGPVGAHYTEYVVPNPVDPVMRVCFRGVDGQTQPLVNWIEVVPLTLWKVDRTLPSRGTKWALSLKKRLRLGGPTILPEQDPRRRRWEAPISSTAVKFNFTGSPVLLPDYSNVTTTLEEAEIEDAQMDPPQPPELYAAALQGGSLEAGGVPGVQILSVRMNYWPLRSSNLLVAKLFFSEVDRKVSQPGERTFSISMRARVVDPSLAQGAFLVERPWLTDSTNDFVDIFAANENSTGPMDPVVMWGCHPQPLLFSTPREILLFLTGQDSPLPPVISGIELYEVVAIGKLNGPCPELTQEELQDAISNSLSGALNAAMPPPPSPPGGLSGGEIFGIVLAAVVVVGLAAGAGVWFYRKKLEEQRLTSFHRFEPDGTF